MYVKVYSQILESSIAVDYQQRHIFQDLLIIADREGIIDMTHEAIARRLNVPEQLIVEKIAKLEQPDPKSRSEEHEGRRLLRLADHRDWGWRVVNYTFYRDLIDAEALRAANRERKREQRARERARHEMSQSVRDKSQESQNVTPSESYSYSVSNSKEERKSKNGAKAPTHKNRRPGSFEELKDYVLDKLHLEENDAAALWEHWNGNGFTNNGKPIVDWRMVASNWERRGFFFPSIQQPKLTFQK